MSLTIFATGGYILKNNFMEKKVKKAYICKI